MFIGIISLIMSKICHLIAQYNHPLLELGSPLLFFLSKSQSTFHYFMSTFLYPNLKAYSMMISTYVSHSLTTHRLEILMIPSYTNSRHSKIICGILSNLEHARQLKEKSLTNKHMYFQAWGRFSNYVWWSWKMHALMPCNFLIWIMHTQQDPISIFFPCCR